MTTGICCGHYHRHHHFFWQKIFKSNFSFFFSLPSVCLSSIIWEIEKALLIMLLSKKITFWNTNKPNYLMEKIAFIPFFPVFSFFVRSIFQTKLLNKLNKTKNLLNFPASSTFISFLFFFLLCSSHSFLFYSDLKYRPVKRAVEIN